MSDITLGQYFPGNSFIHKMDARMKIVLTVAVIVALFICKNFYTLALVTDAIERLFSPLKVFKLDVHSVAMTMTIALRFIPTLIEEIDKITAAQKSRGADLETGNLVHRAKALVPILIPLFISSFRRANELAYAMDCRCYKGGEGRTKMKQVKMAGRDYASLISVIVIFALVIYINTLSAAVI